VSTTLTVVERTVKPSTTASTRSVAVAHRHHLVRLAQSLVGRRQVDLLGRGQVDGRGPLHTLDDRGGRAARDAVDRHGVAEGDRVAAGRGDEGEARRR
jgi:hypothetical protein